MNEKTDKLETGKREDLDKDCAILGSDLCFWLSGKNGCDRCYIKTLKNDEQKVEARERWATTLSLLPADFDAVHETDECQFCVGEVDKADGYAIFEMAHPEPYSAKGMFFGFGKKIRSPVGSLVSIQASVCKRCRTAFRLTDVLQIGILLAGLLIGIFLLMIPAISEPMANAFVLLPVIFVILTGVAGFYIGKNAALAHLKKASKTVLVDIGELPLVKKMLSRGWFFFQETGGMPRVSFQKHKQYDRLRRKTTEDEPVKTEDNDLPLDNMNI